VHRLLAATLDHEVYSNEAEIREIAEECSLNERRAADAERELVEWKKAKFMESLIGDEFDGLIISTARYGAFVELSTLFVGPGPDRDAARRSATRTTRLSAS